MSRSSLKAAARALLPEAAYRPIRTWRVRRIVSTFAPYETTRRKGEGNLRLWISDPLGQAWYDNDGPEPLEIDALRSHGLTSGATVFDLGAHHGVVALMLARSVGALGQVVAVEAEAHNARTAERNAALNGYGNLTVLHAAAGSSSGEIRFAEGLNGHVATSGGLGTVRVPLVSVDDLAERFGDPDVILIDVEGFEAEVLRGATSTIARHRPTMLVEVHVGEGLEEAGSGATEVLALLTDAGYDVSVHDGSEDGSWAAADRCPRAVFDSRFFALAVPAA